MFQGQNIILLYYGAKTLTHGWNLDPYQDLPHREVDFPLLTVPSEIQISQGYWILPLGLSLSDWYSTLHILVLENQNPMIQSDLS